MKKLALISLLFCAVLFSGYRKPDFYTIDSEKNAYYHNNLGLNYLKDHWYYPAIQEFKIAISLSPNENLADCYVELGLVNTKIKQTYENDNPLNLIMRGLLYQRQGKLRDAITTLDEFAVKEPDLIITPAVKGYIKQLVSQLY